jgi:predicted nuclease of predicted toxin-antitoxin system
LKLLFDQKLSHRLPEALAHAFPGSGQVRMLGLDTADDRTIWRYAADHGFCIVTLDSDFADLSALLGQPPKVVWLRCGNKPTAFVEDLIRRHTLRILTLAVTDDVDLIEIG